MSTAFTSITLNKAVSNPSVAILTLARGRKKNAINFAMYNEIQQALHLVSKDAATSALILTGDGEYYSSGNDLSNFSRIMHPKKMAILAKKICYDFVDAFIVCEKPIVAAVNGPAIGIAATTLGLCDVRLATPWATFHTPFRALGQAPEGCSSFLFPKLMGSATAHEVLENGKVLCATEALDCGFISNIADRVVEEAMHVIRSRKDLQRFTKMDPTIVPKLQRVNLDEVTVLEKAWVSPECFEALATYLYSRRKNSAALTLQAMNLLRPLWDR